MTIKKKHTETYRGLYTQVPHNRISYALAKSGGGSTTATRHTNLYEIVGDNYVLKQQLFNFFNTGEIIEFNETGTEDNLTIYLNYTGNIYLKRDDWYYFEISTTMPFANANIRGRYLNGSNPQIEYKKEVVNCPVS